MRPASFDRSRLPSGRTWLVLLVAMVLTVTGLPFALAGDDGAADDAGTATATADGAEANATATEDPIVIPADTATEAPEVEQPAVATETPADPVEPAEPTEPPSDAEPAPAPEKEAADEQTDTAGEPTEAPALAPARTAAAALAANAPDGGDFSVNWLASEPFSYSHVTGGGVYSTGGRDTTVESLNGGDFACGDLVSYLAAITVDDSGATDAATLQFTTSFATLTSSESGIGHEQIVRAVINSGDPGMDGDASVVSLDRSTSGGNLLGVVTVDDLEAGEQIIVRIDVRLGCQTGGRNVGTIHASLTDIRVTAPTTEVVPGGAQTVPFKQDGVRRDLTITKVVVGNPPAGTDYTVTVNCLKGDTATLTFTGSGSQSAGQIPEGDTCTVVETDDGGADRTTVQVNNGTVQNSDTATIVIGASNEVTFTNTFLAPTVTVAKSASPMSVTPGGLITYTITATNTAASATTARDVVVTDDLDDDLADVAATFSVAGGPAEPCDPPTGDNAITCDVGDLAVGQSVVVTVTARATIAACGDVVNRATAGGANFADEQSPQVTVTVVCAPDVDVEKSSSTTDAVPGENFTYTITASNAATATAAATGVVVSDDLDDSLMGVSASFKVDGGATQNCEPIGADNVVTCRVGTLPIGSSAVVTIAVTATPASCPSITNRAVVSGTNFAPDQSDPVDVTITCTPDLTIVKTASETSVVPGQSWNYEITVTSPTSATATSTDVVVTDDLDDSLIVAQPTFSVDGGGAQNCAAVVAGNVIRCVVGDLDPGQSVVVTITATATLGSCGPVVNVALVDSTVVDKGSDVVTVDVVCNPALELDKTASAGTVDAGDDITYTITASNPAGTATAPANDVVITDDLDDDLTGVTGSVTNGATTTDCDVDPGNLITCDAGDIPIGGEAVVTITATTTEAACGVVTNTSEADGSNFATETSPTVDVTVVCPPVIEVVKSASAGTVDAGDDYTYTITATNNADPTGSAAQDVVITDDLDDDLDGVSASFSVAGGADVDCDAVGADNMVRCDIGTLDIGESVDVTIEVTTTEAACGVVSNTSEAEGSNFTTELSNTVDVTVVCPPVIEVVKSASAGTVDAGDDIIYTITAANNAAATGSAARDVVITDDLDDDLTGVTGSVTNGATTTDCDVDPGNLITCDAGDIPIGGEAVVTITATTTEAACGVVTNTSEADGSNFTTETSNTVDVTVVCPPVIEVVKSASAGTVDIGDDYTYTISTTNAAGPTGSTAQDVVVTDDLDDDLDDVSATFTVGAGPEQTCDPTGAGNTIRCELGDLPVGETADVTIAATATLDACGSVTNVSTAVGTNFTSVTSNVVDVTIPCPGPEPSISVVKTGSAPSRDVDDLITYTYVITNTGNTILTEVTLDDDILGPITLTTTTLAPGESTTATATHVITHADVEASEVVNVATTTGRPPTGPPVEDSDRERIPIPQRPSILLEKTPNTEAARVGETVTYSYVITNTGNVRLTDITLVDDKIGTIVSVDDMMTLESGESRTVEADYTLTEADAAAGDEVVNVAIVAGLPPSGQPVTSTDRATVDIPTEFEAPTGALRVVKALDGDGSPAEGATFGFSVDCGDAALTQGDATFTLPADGGTHDVDAELPVDATCTVTETRSAGAVTTTVAVDAGAPTAGTTANVTIVEGVTTVTFVNTFDSRPIIPPTPPPVDPPDLPATGAGVALQLLVGLLTLAVGTGIVRRVRPAGRRRRGPNGWSSRA